MPLLPPLAFSRFDPDTTESSYCGYDQGIPVLPCHLVMDYAPKGDLAQYMSSFKAGRLAEPVTCRFFLQLLSALRYCHKRGVSHRDIKPQNLVLSKDGTLKLSDFGLSALPEQIRPDGRLNDFSSSSLE